MAKRKAAPKDDAVEGERPLQEALADDSVYIGKSVKPGISFCSGSPTGTG